jgi:membrane protein implicated in regulation of membrane protease activity
VLLLVLILVLIAFGLLVVALLSSSVLWAWVSVAVSIAAAAVLLVDWLQRRSAVRAGAEAGHAGPSGTTAVPQFREPVVEPATEVLPVVDQRGEPEASDARRDERSGAEETVVLRALAPSGSAEGPSGARGGTAPSPSSSSQSVTNAEGEEPGSDAAGTDAGPDGQETVRVAGAGSSTRDGPPAAAGAAPRGPSDVAAESPNQPPSDLPPLGPDGAPPEEPHDAEAAARAAEMSDEVFVVDELPRYHVAGCRSLIGSAVIPLSAREAMELGFTPCAWCAPVRSLTTRRAAAR